MDSLWRRMEVQHGPPDSASRRIVGGADCDTSTLSIGLARPRVCRGVSRNGGAPSVPRRRHEAAGASEHDARCGSFPDAHPRRNAMTRPRLVAALAAGALLSGCASVTPVPTTVDMPGMPNPEAALHQSIHHVDAEMAELG